MDERRWLWATCLVIVLLTAPVRQDTAPECGPDLAVIAGVVIDGTGRSYRDAVILILGDRIVDVGPYTGPVDACSVVDASSCTVIPGLINAHVHFNGPITSRPVVEGVLTLFDLGTSIDRLKLLRDSTTPPGSPRVLVTGPIITAVDGYLRGQSHVLAAEVGSAHDARQLVAKLATVHHVDLIKFALSGLAARYGKVNSLCGERAKAIVDTAHLYGLRTFVHVESAEDVAIAIMAGADVLAHVPGEDLSEHLLAELVTRKIPIIPTLAHYGPGPWYRPRLDNVRRLFSLGGVIVLGDDSGGSRIGRPDREMELLRFCGLDEVAIITAGTGHAARAGGIDHWLGTIEPGKVADLIIVDGDASVDISALRRVVMVIQSGKVTYARD